MFLSGAAPPPASPRAFAGLWHACVRAARWVRRFWAAGPRSRRGWLPVSPPRFHRHAVAAPVAALLGHDWQPAAVRRRAGRGLVLADPPALRVHERLLPFAIINIFFFGALPSTLVHRAAPSRTSLPSRAMRRRRDDSVAAAAAETEWSIFLSAAHGRADVVAQLVACGKLTAMLALPLDPAAVRDNVLLVQVPRLLPERSVCFEKSRKVLAKQCSCLLALILRPGLGDWVLPLPPPLPLLPLLSF